MAGSRRGSPHTVYLAHWKDVEAAERAARLEAAGYAVRYGFEELRVARDIKSDLPDAVVIDLGRLPSKGRAIATWIRTIKATRHLPVVFVDGKPEKVEPIAEEFPENHVTTWAEIRPVLRRAIGNPPANPPPRAEPGPSRAPLAKKLGVKPDTVLALLGAPKDFGDTLGTLPAGVSVRRRAQGTNDVVVLFAKSRADLVRRFASAHRTLAEGGGLWVAWPKKTSGVQSDLDQAFVMKHGLESGLVDNKICAIDATWSGLRFQRRRR